MYLMYTKSKSAHSAEYVNERGEYTQLYYQMITGALMRVTCIILRSSELQFFF